MEYRNQCKSIKIPATGCSGKKESIAPQGSFEEDCKNGCCAMEEVISVRDECEEKCCTTKVPTQQVASSCAKAHCDNTTTKSDEHVESCCSDGAEGTCTKSPSDNLARIEGKNTPISFKEVQESCCCGQKETQPKVSSFGSMCNDSNSPGDLQLKNDKSSTCSENADDECGLVCCRNGPSDASTPRSVSYKTAKPSICQKDHGQTQRGSINSIRCSSDKTELEPCSAHFEAMTRKFNALLEAGLCICRNVLQRSETCCDEKKRASAAEARARRAVSQLQHTEGSSSAISYGDLDYAQHKKRKNGDSCQKSDHGKEVYSNCDRQGVKGIPTIKDTKIKEKTMTTSKFVPNAIKSITHDVDLEQSILPEHTVFSVSGMTCTGCVKKILGVLDHVPGVSNVSVNFVACRGEFDVNTTLKSTDQVLRQLEHETGFECARILDVFLSLDLLMTEEDVKCLNNTPVPGIEAIDRHSKGRYRVSFDPSRIGARTILAKSNGHLAPPIKDKLLADGQKKFIWKLGYFIASTLMTIPIVVLAWGDPRLSPLTKSVILLVLGTGVQLIAVPEFYTPAIKALIFSRSIEMDMLVVISITAAYVYSVVAFGLTEAGYVLEQGELFETSTLLITLVLLGRLTSAYAKVWAVGAVSSKSLQAETAYLEYEEGGEPMEIDARLLEYNDVIRVPPHSRIVTDGEVIRGSSAVDESMLTGESAPVAKQSGSVVIAGTVNGAGPLTVRTTRLPGQNSISEIVNLVSNALGAKPKVQDLADMVAGWFVPVVVTIAIIVFIIWLTVSIKVRSKNAGGAIGTALTYSIAVLAISCPCALGLAVPLVLVVAGGVAAKAGVVMKSSSATEHSFKVTDVVFDKTGTLTLGDLRVTREEFCTENAKKDDAVAITFALVKDNEHPVSRAVVSHLRSQSVSPVKLAEIKSIPGAGIKAMWMGAIVKAGNPSWLNVSTHAVVNSLQSQGLTLLCITLNDKLIATFGLQATTRPEAAHTINALQSRNIQCHIVSGDNVSAVKALARTLSIPESNIFAQAKPDDKQKYIQALQNSSNNAGGKRTVLFLGDGTNDAAAIAQANVGLQIGDTSDISRAASDVVLLGGLDGILILLDISKASFHRIIFNFVWSAVYNLLAILPASGAFVKFRIPPAYAGLGEIVSVLPVVAVALSLKLVKYDRASRL